MKTKIVIVLFLLFFVNKYVILPLAFPLEGCLVMFGYDDTIKKYDLESGKNWETIIDLKSTLPKNSMVDLPYFQNEKIYFTVTLHSDKDKRNVEGLSLYEVLSDRSIKEVFFLPCQYKVESMNEKGYALRGVVVSSNGEEILCIKQVVSKKDRKSMEYLHYNRKTNELKKIPDYFEQAKKMNISKAEANVNFYEVSAYYSAFNSYCYLFKSIDIAGKSKKNTHSLGFYYEDKFLLRDRNDISMNTVYAYDIETKEEIYVGKTREKIMRFIPNHDRKYAAVIENIGLNEAGELNIIWLNSVEFLRIRNIKYQMPRHYKIFWLKEQI